MSTLNPESDILEQANALDEKKWTFLQAEICMNVANAKLEAFSDECGRAAEYVRLGLIPRSVAANYLHVAAVYNQLYFEYGADRIQKIMAQAAERRAA
jgi:hypothetical protein